MKFILVFLSVFMLSQMVYLRDEIIGSRSSGFIALQIHSGGGIKVLWKDIVINEL